ncbi:hypothetical protein CKAN_00320900 [Cinnamomum micranthum f. kanehirae]|uniref:Uncharacterized protein n=1 Tax=Cinnamomum micranthum f. kanehirae TaxID=337451 RepID=A0A443N8P5_9MAGN|nr:hypothetical protein CKAN_00320900 [Cinnamomum micranthum f. kanehirae]
MVSSSSLVRLSIHLQDFVESYMVRLRKMEESTTKSLDHLQKMKASFNMILRKILYAVWIDHICLDWCILVGLIATCYRGTRFTYDWTTNV